MMSAAASSSGKYSVEVPAEVGRLVREQAAAVLAQVEGVEVPAAFDEEVGQVGLEEVVGETVQVEHGAPGGLVGPAADQGGQYRALVVVSEIDRLVLVRSAEQVRFHALDVISP